MIFPVWVKKKDLGGFQIDCLKNGLKLESSGPKKRMKNSIECLKDLKGIGDLFSKFNYAISIAL